MAFLRASWIGPRAPWWPVLFAVERWLTSERVEENYVSPDMALWMVHPVELNKLTNPNLNGFPNTWTEGNMARENCRLAFHTRDEKPEMLRRCQLQPSRYPLAVIPSNVDSRTAVQRSCFMIYGTDERDIESMLLDTALVPKCFRKYTVPRAKAQMVHRELRFCGTRPIHRSTCCASQLAIRKARPSRCELPHIC